LFGFEVSQLLAYQIGGIFLLAALFMLGTMSGLVPKLFRGNATAILGGIVVLGFVSYFYGSDIRAWRPWQSSPPQQQQPQAVSTPAPAAVVHNRARPAAVQTSEPAKLPEPKVIVWSDDVPVAQPKAADPEPAQSREPATTATSLDSDESSPYDSKAKRAIKSIGRALHIHKNNNQ
jgi:hypothetical protein